jgi:uncharacterized protein
LKRWSLSLSKVNLSKSSYLYLHGFASSPQSRKAQFFLGRMRGLGLEMAIPDLAEGDFAGLTISKQLALMERETAGRKVRLMGSSLGGYLAALYAERHPEQVERLVMLAPAFRLAERWEQRTGAAAMAEWERTGAMAYFHYGEKRELALGWEFMADARRYPAQPAFGQPALIFHGEGDDVVPVEDSVEFVARHPNARLQVMTSDHELGDCMEEMWAQLGPFLTAEF